MNRDEQEMAIWREAYWACRGTTAAYCAHYADAAVAEFRKRYPATPTAPAPAWYDEPPFPKNGKSYPCWIYGEDDACAVRWSEFAVSPQWVYLMPGEAIAVRLNGRSVCPITKPQEPTS